MTDTETVLSQLKEILEDKQNSVAVRVSAATAYVNAQSKMPEEREQINESAERDARAIALASKDPLARHLVENALIALSYFARADVGLLLDPAAEKMWRDYARAGEVASASI